MSETQNTSLAIRLPWWSVTLILYALLEGVSFAHDGFRVSGNTLHDYDTVTRLAYIRDVMARHGWQQGYFARINAPYGMHLHWTLPFNLILLCIVKFFAIFNSATALQYAGYWTGPIFRAVIAPVAYWAGRQMLSPAASAFAAFMIVFSPYLLGYGHRGTANHHVLLVLDAILMAGFAFRVGARPQAKAILPLALGFVAAFSLWTTFELVILIAPLFLGLFILWMAEGEIRVKQLVLTSAAFSITTTFALLVDPPFGGVGVVTYDHVSAAFQTLASLPLIVAFGAWLLPFDNHLKRFRYFAVAGAGVSLAWLMAYPSAIQGVQGAMDPYVAREWLGQIEEVQPIHAWRRILFLLGPGLLSLLLVFKWQNKLHRDPTLLGIGFLYILAQLHFRFAGYVAIAAAYFLGFVYDCVSRRNGEFAIDAPRLVKPVAVGLCGIYFAVQVAMIMFNFNVMDDGGKDDGITDSVTCSTYPVRNLLDDRKWMGIGNRPPIVINEVNDAAALVYWTDVRTLAGNYHRDSQGIKDDYQFFRDMGDDVARGIVAKRGVDFVLLCGNGNNPSYSFVSVAKAAEELAKPGEEFTPQETLYTRLTDQQPPPWLKLRDWPDDIDTDLLLYEVDKSKLGPPPAK